jgi:hypothetical protein
VTPDKDSRAKHAKDAKKKRRGFLGALGGLGAMILGFSGVLRGLEIFRAKYAKGAKLKSREYFLGALWRDGFYAI